jgi:probable rRNA maturation factor
VEAALNVDVFDETGRLGGDQTGWIKSHIERAIKHLGTKGSVRVRVVADAAMAAAHAEFAGVEGTTDVLTFDLTDPEEAGPPEVNPETGRLASDSNTYGLDADILVCVDEGLRQSGERGYPVERELLLYVVHGVLHCLGMDDHDEASFEAMHRAEDAILTAIGVGPVFSAARPGEGASG